jgi:hypothetical protein
MTRNELDGNFEHVVSAALAYEHEFDGLGVAAALVGESGENEDAFSKDLAAWHLGGSLSYEGFSLAGSYGDWGDSGMAVGTDSNSGFWTLGGAYAWGEAGASINYLSSDLGDNAYHALTAGADYVVAPGLVPYAEVTFFDANDTGTTLDNNGTVLLLGTYLYF